MYLGSEQQKVKLEYRQSWLLVSPFLVYILGLNRLLNSIVVTSKRAKSVKIQQRGVCGGEYKFSMLILRRSLFMSYHIFALNTAFIAELCKESCNGKS